MRLLSVSGEPVVTETRDETQQAGDIESAETFGRYRLIRQLSAGGMGELYLAALPGAAGLEKRVAIKKILRHLSGEPEFVERFIDEARIAMTLSHGNIVPVFELGEVDGEYFIAMEYVDGLDLREILRRQRARGEPLPLPIALYVAGEVAKALAYAHGRVTDEGRPMEIVHRDVSPSNVLISRDGSVKLTDFGIARARSRLSRSVTGQLQGKFAYMSPEQASGESVDARSDIFSLGVVLFEMLSGRRPFEGEGEMEVLARVQRGERPRLDEVAPELPAEVVETVERALALEPSDRFEDSEALQIALARQLHELDQPATAGALARFVRAIDDDPSGRRGAGVGSGPGIDTLLRRQLDEAIGDGPRIPTPTGTSTGSAPQIPPSVDGGGRWSEGTITRTPTALGQRVASTVDDRSRRRRLYVLGLVAAMVLGAVTAAILYLSRPTELALESDPPGGRVLVDNVFRGVTPLRMRLRPGPHRVAVERDGFEAWVRELELEPRTTTELAPVLSPAAAGAQEAVEARGDSAAEIGTDDAAERAAVVFDVEPAGATIVLNGERIDPDDERVSLDPGEPVSIEIAAPGHETFRGELQLDPGENVVRRSLVASPAEPTRTGERSSGTSSGRAEPERTAEEAGAPEPRRQTRRIEIGAIPSDGSLYLDGERVADPRAITLPLDGREHTLRVELDGVTRWSTTITADDSLPARVTPSLADAESGTLVVRFVEEPMVANISIDGAERGANESTAERFELPAGPHDVLVVNDASGRTDRGRVVVEPGAEAVFTVDWR